MTNRPSDQNAAFIKAAIKKRSGKGSIHPPISAKEEERTAEQLISTAEDGEEETESIRYLGGKGYEYLDHTADIQLHAWGDDLSCCLVQLIRCMFGYMTCIDLVEIDEEMSLDVGKKVIAQGHDWLSLVYSFMDEWLFVFHDTGFIAKELEIIAIDRDRFTITSSGKGEKMDLNKHTQGTEIKAITYSNMKISETDDQCDIWVIVDI